MGVIRWLRRLCWLGVVVYIASLAWVLYTVDQSLELYGDGHHLAKGAGVAIVLGSGTRGDGILQYAARRRVTLGVRLLTEGKVDHLVMSGGPERHYAQRAADSMAEYAIALGAPEAAISREDRSRTTFENLLYTRDLLARDGRKIDVIVTDPFHIYRASALAWAIGLDTPKLAAVATPRSATAETGWQPLLREAASWWLNMGRVAAWHLNGKRWPF